jgi:hypothetical protein
MHVALSDLLGEPRHQGADVPESFRNFPFQIIPSLWSSQDLVDTTSRTLVSSFKLLRTDTAEITVAACSIVEGIDVVGDVS